VVDPAIRIGFVDHIYHAGQSVLLRKAERVVALEQEAVA
jgi:hypothetical protein